MRRLYAICLRNARISRTQVRFACARHKVVTAEDAAYLVPCNSTITVGGFVMQGAAEEILAAITQRYKDTGKPQGLTLIFGIGPGDMHARGICNLALPGLLRRSIGANYALSPRLAKLARDGAIEAYNVPMGVISRMIRCAASGSPGHITTIGYGTFVDPKNGGGKINSKTTEDIVSEVEILGKKYLLYKAFPIDVAIVRGTTADPDGNITMERESLYTDHMIQAMAARSRRGVTLAQVERIAAYGSLHPRDVRIPGTMVDAVVVAKPENHWMSYATQYNAAESAECQHASVSKVLILNERKIIARRALFEITPNQVVTFGIGTPEAVAAVAEEEGVTPSFDVVTDTGVHSCCALFGLDYGAATDYHAIIEMNQQFDFYNGGGLDMCFLGMAQVTPHGDVNVTRIGTHLTGPGGFIDVTQSTERVNILGTFTTDGLVTKCVNGKLVIEKEGKIKKFVKTISEVTFSGAEATRRKQVVNYITERAVFSLTPHGLELVEIAPGINLQTQILDQMEFEPIIVEPLRTMRAEIFRPEVMKLSEEFYGLTLPQRLHFDKATNTIYVNLHGLTITSLQMLQEVDVSVRNYVASCANGGRVNAVVNYDHFYVHERYIKDWALLAESLRRDCYLHVRRLSGTAFSRHKLATSIHVHETKMYSLAEVMTLARQRGVEESNEALRNIFRKHDFLQVGALDAKTVEQLLDDLKRHRRAFS